MKMKIVIVGSGPSAVAAATALVNHNCDVEMLDFGNEMEDKARDLSFRLKHKVTESDINILKNGFHNNSLYNKPIQNNIFSLMKEVFTSKAHSSHIKKKQFGSHFIYKDTDKYVRLTENSPEYHKSLAKGGLSNVWGAATYPFTDDDFEGWPVSKKEMDTHYLAVNDILQINEKIDHLADIYNAYKPKEINILLNPQSLDLLKTWGQFKEKLNNNGFLFGQSRLAVLTQSENERTACQYCGLCLYGCPYGSIYNSAYTINTLNNHSNFRYTPGFFLRRFKESVDGKISLEVEDVKNKTVSRIECDTLFLGTGILSTLRIVADSFELYPENIPIIDNDLYLLPLVKMSNWNDFDRKVKFTLSQLALIIKDESICDEIIHTQLYSYNDYIFDRFSPIVDILPGIVKEKIKKMMFNTFIMFVYLHSKHSAKINAKVIRGSDGAAACIDIKYRENPSSKAIINSLVNCFKLNKRALNLYPIKIGMKISEPGISSHMAGSLPMRKNPKLFETGSNGLLYGTKSVYIVDQSVVPVLPAQNSTYTAMANAHRIATKFSKYLK